MNDEAAFLAAIAAAPGDPTPRLVYADWLEERGDPRAEFIRLQHQLADLLDRLPQLRGGFDLEWVRSVEVRRDVVLHTFTPEQRRHVTKLVRLHTGMGFGEANAFLAGLPAAVLRNLPLDRAEQLRREFAEVAAVTLAPPTPGAS